MASGIKEQAKKSAEDIFSGMLSTAFDDLTIKQDIDDACDFQKNTEILNIIHSRIKNQIEMTLLNNNLINNFVFDKLINLVKTPNTELNKVVIECLIANPLTKNNNSLTNTYFFQLKNFLPKFIEKKYSVECPNAGSQVVKGGSPLYLQNGIPFVKSNFNPNDLNKLKETTIHNFSENEEFGDDKDPNAPTVVESGKKICIEGDVMFGNTETMRNEVSKNLKKIISGMQNNIKTKLADSVKKIFDDPKSIPSLKLKDYTNDMVNKISQRIRDSSLLNGGDIFSVIYFYLVLEQLENANDENKKKIVNDTSRDLFAAQITATQTPVANLNNATQQQSIITTQTTPVANADNAAQSQPIISTQTPPVKNINNVTNDTTQTKPVADKIKLPFLNQLLTEREKVDGGRRTKRVSKKKKRTQKKYFNKKKNITYRKK